jgi:hypothetical protein
MNKREKETIREFLLRGEKEESFLISDVAKHGCSGGTISELIYYNDTTKFHDEHEDEIWDELNNLSLDLGEWPISIIKDMNGSKHIDSICQLKNLLSWWACEVIAQRIMDEREQDKEVA